MPCVTLFETIQYDDIIYYVNLLETIQYDDIISSLAVGFY